MPCFSPLTGYKDTSGRLVFKSTGTVSSMKVPCGQCIGCRIDRTRAWAMRCVHESKKHNHNSFITLTYAPRHLPHGGNLQIKDFQDFMKRLRKPLPPRSVSFFHCGEYGDDPSDITHLSRSVITPRGTVLGRPHYHALLFGIDFLDKTPWKKSHTGDQIYRSEALDKLWGKGHASVGAVTEQTAAYTAGYIFKKINGDLAEDHYTCLLDEGGFIQLQPEYITMSRRPAVGADWIATYADEVYWSDQVIFRGHPTKPPRFYDKQLKKENPSLYDLTKNDSTFKRLDADTKQKENNRPQRLKVRATVTRAKISTFKRNLS